MSSSTIISRDWDDVVGTYDGTSSSRSGLRQVVSNCLNHSGFAAFSTTFRYMFREEWRENIDFAKKRQVVLFPLLLTLVTMVTTVGLQFLVGDSAAQSSDMDTKSFTWDQLRFALHLPLLFFSLGMGTFAFRGRELYLNGMATRTTSSQHLPFNRYQIRWRTTPSSSKNWFTTLC